MLNTVEPIVYIILYPFENQRNHLDRPIENDRPHHNTVIRLTPDETVRRT